MTSLVFRQHHKEYVCIFLELFLNTTSNLCFCPTNTHFLGLPEFPSLVHLSENLYPVCSAFQIFPASRQEDDFISWLIFSPRDHGLAMIYDLIHKNLVFPCKTIGFPGGPVGKISICNAGDAGDMGSILDSGKPPGGCHGNPLHYSCLETKKPGQRLWTEKPDRLWFMGFQRARHD